MQVDAIAEDLQKIPAQIQTHREIAMKAEAVASKIKSDLEANGGECTSDIDARALKFLTNCSARKKELEDARKPLTIGLDLIKKQFTETQGKLDPSKGGFAGEIQDIRNTYAKKVLEEQEAKKREAEQKARAEKALADAKIKFANDLATEFANAIFRKVKSINDSFAAITLETYDQKSAGLKAMSVEPPQKAIDDLIAQFKMSATMAAVGLDGNTQLLLVMDTVKAFDLDSWKAKYIAEIQSLKDVLVDRLPSKKTELEQMAAAGEAERQRLETEAKERQLKAEQELAEKQLAEQKRLDDLAAQQKAASNAEILFEQSVATATTEQAPETRVGYEITVLHPVGWTEIFQVWYQKKGMAMAVDAMGSTKLDAMKTFVEGLVKSDDFRIESKFLKYEKSVKAVNRKAK